MIQMFEIHYTNKFKKDYKTITHRGYQLELLKDAIRRLAKNGTLPKKFLPHLLSGKYKDTWECHIKPDWLLKWSVDYQADEIWGLSLLVWIFSLKVNCINRIWIFTIGVDPIIPCSIRPIFNPDSS